MTVHIRKSTYYVIIYISSHIYVYKLWMYIYVYIYVNEISSYLSALQNLMTRQMGYPG